MTLKKIEEDYATVVGYVEQYIASPRKEQLLKLYDELGQSMMLSPASGFEHFHNAFAGGYLDHVINVVKFTLKVREMWYTFGCAQDHTEEEAVFSALNHDLGKLGFKEGPQYIPNPSEWHRKNQGLIYENNPEISFMMVPDRSLFLLQQAGIVCTLNETYAIKLHDGSFEESNKGYFTTFKPSAKLRTNLPFILQQADLMAARIEYEKWRDASVMVEDNPAKKLFKDLFKEKE